MAARAAMSVCNISEVTDVEEQCGDDPSNITPFHFALEGPGLVRVACNDEGVQCWAGPALKHAFESVEIQEGGEMALNRSKREMLASRALNQHVPFTKDQSDRTMFRTGTNESPQEMVNRLSDTYNQSSIAPTRRILLHKTMWNAKITLMDGEHIWGTDTVSNLYKLYYAIEGHYEPWNILSARLNSGISFYEGDELREGDEVHEVPTCKEIKQLLLAEVAFTTTQWFGTQQPIRGKVFRFDSDLAHEIDRIFRHSTTLTRLPYDKITSLVHDEGMTSLTHMESIDTEVPNLVDDRTDAALAAHRWARARAHESDNREKYAKRAQLAAMRLRDADFIKERTAKKLLNSLGATELLEDYSSDDD
jgi:hypothetical protein